MVDAHPEDERMPFAQLGPDAVLDAVESTGRLSDARMLALNSYENRVWQIGIEDDAPVIAKFYRPERWSDEAILEEHAFAQPLPMEIPAVLAACRAGWHDPPPPWRPPLCDLSASRRQGTSTLGPGST